MQLKAERRLHQTCFATTPTLCFENRLEQNPPSSRRASSAAQAARDAQPRAAHTVDKALAAGSYKFRQTRFDLFIYRIMRNGAMVLDR